MDSNALQSIDSTDDNTKQIKNYFSRNKTMKKKLKNKDNLLDQYST